MITSKYHECLLWYIIKIIVISGDKQTIVTVNEKDKFNSTFMMLTGVNIGEWLLHEMHVNFILISL